MKIYNLSPHRSGTRSFVNFMLAHGIPAKHWIGPEEDARLETADILKQNGYDEGKLFASCRDYYSDADAFADFPTPLVLQALLENCQDYWLTTRFIVVMRRPTDWVKSIRGHIAGKDLTFLERLFYTLVTGRTHQRLDAYTEEELIYGYGFHIGMLNAAFCGARVPYLTVHLNDPDIGGKISGYCGFKQQHDYPAIGKEP